MKKRESGERSADSGEREEPAATPVRNVTRALKKFDAEPNALALALRDHLGEAGAKTLVSALRRVLK